jgi:hypothetical protein
MNKAASEYEEMANIMHKQSLTCNFGGLLSNLNVGLWIKESEATK